MSATHMDGLTLIDLALAFTSGLLALTLALAWRLIDRPRHALTWALAFGCGAAQWAISGFGATLLGSRRGVVAGGLACAMATLVAVGARQRAGRPDRALRFAVAWAAATALIAVTALAFPDTAMRLVATNLYPPAVLAFAVLATLRRGRRLTSPEIYLAVALSLSAAYGLALATAAVGSNGPHGVGAAYSALYGVALPPVLVVLGLSILFVLGGDLALRLHALVTTDPLTGALNRRGLEQAALPILAAARRHERSVTAIIADLDSFKAINDLRGHAAGDEALCRFARAAQELIRDGDLFARLGGDEFCLLLAEATPASAVLVTDRIRATLGDTVTASFGVATMRAGEPLDALLARADAALYRAKEHGRDRAMMAAE